jgi:hypothetical protein
MEPMSKLEWMILALTFYTACGSFAIGFFVGLKVKR